MRSIGVEEAAAVGAQHLDGDLGRHRPDGDRLLGTLQRRCLDVGPERLRHALRDEEEAVDHANGQEDVERAAGDIDPEIPDRAHRRAGKAADQGDRQDDAGGCGKEVLVREAQHLHEIGHRAFAAVVLPVGVGDEADRRVEGEVGGNRRLLGRIEGQHALQAHQRIEDDEAADMKQQHGDRVGQPVLLARRVDAAIAVEQRLDRLQHRRQEGALAVEDARHVAAERLHQGDDDSAVEEDLDPADEGHGGAFRTARVAAGHR